MVILNKKVLYVLSPVSVRNIYPRVDANGVMPYAVEFFYELFGLSFVAGADNNAFNVIRRRGYIDVEEFIAVGRVYYLETFLYKERTELPQLFGKIESVENGAEVFCRVVDRYSEYRFVCHSVMLLFED